MHDISLGQNPCSKTMLCSSPDRIQLCWGSVFIPVFTVRTERRQTQTGRQTYCLASFLLCSIRHLCSSLCVMENEGCLPCGGVQRNKAALKSNMMSYHTWNIRYWVQTSTAKHLQTENILCQGKKTFIIPQPLQKLKTDVTKRNLNTFKASSWSDWTFIISQQDPYILH